MKNSANRRKSKVIQVGNVKIGGENPIIVQSMTNTDTRNVKDTLAQIKELENAGCEIVRVAIPDKESSKNLKIITEKVNVPIVADIHFDYKLAISAVENGAKKIRINPGNIGAKWKVGEIVSACLDKNVPIRVGGNSGSIKESYMKKFGNSTSEALVLSVMDEIKIIEAMGFELLVVSLKSSDVEVMIEANQIFSQKRNYPIHLGVTESGPPGRGEVFSAVGIGKLLYDGIGDTIRVSLTGHPVYEVITAYNILDALNLRRHGPRIISCPTCGRLEYDMERVLKEVEKIVRNVKEPLTIAVMGCSVNGPGEAKEADIGIAGGKNSAVIFRKGEIIASVNEDRIIKKFMSELKAITGEESWQ